MSGLRVRFGEGFAGFGAKFARIFAGKCAKIYANFVKKSAEFCANFAAIFSQIPAHFAPNSNLAQSKNQTARHFCGHFAQVLAVFALIFAFSPALYAAPNSANTAKSAQNSAQKLEVFADEIFADEGAQTSVLTGNVRVKKGDFDELTAKKIVINVNERREPQKYTATGNVEFRIMLGEQRYDGTCERLTYEPARQFYTFETAVFLREIGTRRTISAEKIIADQLRGTYNASNKKSPVKITFELEN